MILLFWLGCSRSPAWTEAEALAPHRARLDTDGDGRVSAAEYEAHLWNGPPMGSADTDRDGDLSVSELGALVAAQSPTHFDGEPEEAPLGRAGAGLQVPKGEARDVWEVLVWMDDALRAAGEPGLPPDAVAAAVHSGSFTSPASNAAFAVLRPRWEAHGWVWPEGVP